jgi:AraC-like DNA-binding protein
MGRAPFACGGSHMIVVLDRESQLAQRSLPCTPVPPLRRLFVHDWGEFERAAPRAVCSVVVIEWLDGGADAESLRAFRLRHPLHPVVLVTQGCMENARHLHQLPVEEVVWLAEAATALPGAVQRAVTSGSRHALAAAVAGAAHLPRTLREALLHACTAARPVYSVAELAARVHCDRTTLCMQWRKAVGRSPPVRLVDFLAMILLVHATQLRLRGHKTPEIALELGVHEHTLRRLTRRLSGDAVRPSPRELQVKLTLAVEEFTALHLRAAAPAHAHPAPGTAPTLA